MKITLKPKSAKEIIITDEHSASSYGIPVAIVDGIAYGPADVLPIWLKDELAWLHESAAQTVASVALASGLSGKELEFVRRFYL